LVDSNNHLPPFKNIPPAAAFAETGLYSPQLGGALTVTGMLYNNGADTPWLFQKWFSQWLGGGAEGWD
jgi:hypothetical protein